MDSHGGGRDFRTLVGIGLGNALEWYDWGIYATLSAFFASRFFAAGDGAASAVLKTLAVFAVGFVARPFGGVLFGWLADRRGRRPSMALSVGLAGAGSLLIGVCPGRETIGLAAPVVLLLARLLQGLAHGGELPAAQTYLAEMAPPARRGLWSSLIYVSGSIGVLAGTLLGAALSATVSRAQMVEYGWRLPFLLGGLFGMYALVMRLRMAESDTFTAAVERGDRRPGPRLGTAPGAMARVVGLTVGFTVAYYAWSIGAPAFAISSRHIDPTAALLAGSGSIVVFLIALPIWGAVSDRIGRRPALLVGGGLLAVLLVPLDAMVHDSGWRLFAAASVALALIASAAAVSPAVFAELFPTGIRAAGLGLPYSIAVAVFGGTAPYLQTWLSGRGAPAAFGWYAVGATVITLVTVWFLPETRGRDLRDPQPASAAGGGPAR